MNKKILIATRNQAKCNELQRALSILPCELVSLNDLHIDAEVEETEPTFVGNAQLKATTYAQLSGLPTISDDGGLTIDALQGWPGVRSARVAPSDHQKIALVLDRMKQIPEQQRTAHFVGIIAYVEPDGLSKVFEASISGIITNQPKGQLIKGFPYRTIFLLREFGKTMAQLDADKIKYSSHRQKAIDLLINYFLGATPHLAKHIF